MAQKVLFPMQNIRCTQNEYSTYSHAGSLAMDFGGKSGANDDKLYAPCDMVCKRVRTDSSHEMYFESTGPVECADGYVGIVHFTFMHDNHINGNVKTGRVIKQGEYFADEGGFGGGKVDRFARHAHIEAGKGPSPMKQVRNSKGTYITAPQSHLYDIFFVAADATIIPGQGKHTWKRTTDKLMDTSGNGTATNTQTEDDDMTIGLYTIQEAYLSRKEAESTLDKLRTGASDPKEFILTTMGNADYADGKTRLMKRRMKRSTDGTAAGYKKVYAEMQKELGNNEILV